MDNFVRLWTVLVMLGSGALAKESSIEVRTGEGETAATPAKIADVDFLIGHWIGSGLGGCSEEVIAPRKKARDAA